MKKTVIAILSLLFAGFMVESCSDVNCPLSTTSLAYFDLRTENNMGVKLDTVTISATAIINGQAHQDTIINLKSGLSSLQLPLSYNEKTEYTIHYTQKLKDRITIEYTSKPYLSNIECGTVMFYHVDHIEYSTNVLDSVVIVNPDITNEEKINFTIYYTVNQ